MNARLSTRHGFLALAFATLLTGCAPTVAPTYQLEPVSGAVTTIDGRPVTRVDDRGVGVVASFEREDLSFVVFDVEVKNQTERPIDVDPADFRFAALGVDQDTLSDPADNNRPFIHEIANPAYELGRVAFNRKLEEKRLKRARVFNTIALVAVIASDVATSNNSRTYGEYVTKRITHDVAYQAIAAKRVIDQGTFANRMQRYDYEEYRWNQLALKRNTLQPGESVRGMVYIPKVPTAHYLNLAYTLPEVATVPILFRQQQQQQPGRRRR
ncbi:hypothetical protein GCM10027578_26220 [Spirosoma luteolum]